MKITTSVEVYPMHGGDLLWASRRYGISPEAFLDFSANVNPLGPPASALEAMGKAMEEITRYPEPQGQSLKEALSVFLDTDASAIMLGNGSTELIHHICRCERPGRVSVLAPAFAEYERAARLCGSTVSFFRLSHEDEFAIDGEELAAAVAKSDIAFVCNPASPSGLLYERKDLLPALEAFRAKGALMVVDESFMGFCEPEAAAGATLLPETYGGGLVIISTMTKLFALAGLRGPGWLVSDKNRVERLEEAAFPWRVNTLAQAASLAALEDTAYLENTWRNVAEWRDELREGLEEAGHFETYPSSANFLLLRILGGRYDSASLCHALGRRGILIRDCANFRGLDSRFMRVSVQRPEKNARLLEALREVWE